MGNGKLGSRFDDGEVIFREGEKGNSMYVIQEGEVEIRKSTPLGDARIATLRSGDIFGEMSLFDQLPRSATAVVSGSARLLQIDKSKLFSAIGRDPTLVFKIVESMSRRIRELDEEITKLAAEDDISHRFADVERTAVLVLEKAGKLVPAPFGMLVLKAGAEGETLVFTPAGLTQASAESARALSDLLERTALRGRGFVINGSSREAIPALIDKEIASLLCAPLYYNKSIVGLIVLGGSGPATFSAVDLGALAPLAEVSAAALRNALAASELIGAARKFLHNVSPQA